MTTNDTAAHSVTAADFYASAASAASTGHTALAVELEEIADHMAARRPMVGYVTCCPDCRVAFYGTTPRATADTVAAHVCTPAS